MRRGVAGDEETASCWGSAISVSAKVAPQAGHAAADRGTGVSQLGQRFSCTCAALTFLVSPRFERTQRLCSAPPERANLRPVVVVGDLARPVVEFEFLQRRECPIALLGQLEPPPLVGAELVQPVARRRRIAQERSRDEDDRNDGEQRGEHERPDHPQTRAAAAPGS